jgi:hypothetical protein
MMTYRKVGDILDAIRDYHKQFRQKLEDVEGAADFTLTESLAEQLQVHEQQWQIALKEYGDQGEYAVLNTYIQYIPDDALQNFFQSVAVTSQMSTDDVRQLVMRFHSALVDLYGTLKDEVSAPRVKEFFVRLHDLEQSLIAEQAWSGRLI